MKKVITALFSILLIISMTQPILAKGKAEFTLGYAGFPFADYNSTHGLKIGVSADYKFTDLFALGGGINGILDFKNKDGVIDIDLKGKFDVYNRKAFNMGLQIVLKDMVGQFAVNIFMVGIGAYGNFNVSSNFDLYADLKIPLFSLITQKNKSPQSSFGVSVDATLRGYYYKNLENRYLIKK